MEYAKIILTSSLGGIERDKENLLKGKASTEGLPEFLKFDQKDIEQAIEKLDQRFNEVMEALILINSTTHPSIRG